MSSKAPLHWLRTAALDASYLVLGLPVGSATFTIAVTGFSLGAGLAITLVGIPIMLGTLVLMRWLGHAERYRAALVLGKPFASGERRLTGTVWDRSKRMLSDPVSWFATLWSVLLLPVGIAGFTVAVAVWSTALGLLSSPAWTWAVDHGDAPGEVGFFTSTAVAPTIGRALLGLALIPVAYWTSRGLALGTAQLARLLLGEREEAPTKVLPANPAVA
ncbi:MAG TPA: sensor domain-containing protein [Solirubrobacterales bacterium]|nr:sensor domain-containing protein [Solirubrobacterales bacterium]